MHSYFGLVSIGFLVSQSLGFATTNSIINCADNQIDFKIVTPWPSMEGSAEIRGRAIETWLNGQDSLIPMHCLRRGGSSMPTSWACSTELGEGKSIRATFWHRDRESHARIFLEENGRVVATYEPECRE
jgi:hypothetical protein